MRCPCLCYYSILVLNAFQIFQIILGYNRTFVHLHVNVGANVVHTRLQDILSIANKNVIWTFDQFIIILYMQSFFFEIIAIYKMVIILLIVTYMMIIYILSQFYES